MLSVGFIDPAKLSLKRGSLASCPNVNCYGIMNLGFSLAQRADMS